jgi:hypothetical protein
MTLKEAREALIAQLYEGAICPCCEQFAKVYKRKLNSGIARALIVMYRAAGTTWLHKPTVLAGLGAAARDESIARYWDLIEEDSERRSDGGRAGWWRVTKKGADFVQDEIRVPKYALLYNNQLIALEGPEIGIQDALGDRFNYDELMQA